MSYIVDCLCMRRNLAARASGLNRSKYNWLQRTLAIPGCASFEHRGFFLALCRRGHPIDVDVPPEGMDRKKFDQ